MALAPLHVIALVWSCMIWYFNIVLHVLSTPKYDKEQLVWSYDTMRFVTVVYCVDGQGYY